MAPNRAAQFEIQNLAPLSVGDRRKPPRSERRNCLHLPQIELQLKGDIASLGAYQRGFKAEKVGLAGSPWDLPHPDDGKVASLEGQPTDPSACEIRFQLGDEALNRAGIDADPSWVARS
ncbi:MAG: hypothetical protein UZ18_ATM001000255 [Armatimonadetes bacterium OLB18]|nr:MAG: hypothetical protein UZ18_ATM001000255 [Armatimonadetes bacterium OLB18]